MGGDGIKLHEFLRDVETVVLFETINKCFVQETYA